MEHILHSDQIELGGFHGIKQKRLIVNPTYGPGSGVRAGTWPGIGSLIYLADSIFEPGVATGLHPHQGVDVLTFVVNGQLDHEGSLEHGTELRDLNFQVQKSGLEGFVHNEVNKGNTDTRMIQLWMVPQQAEQKATFRLYKAKLGEIQRVYGLEDTNTTQLDLAHLRANQSLELPKRSIVYVVEGSIKTSNSSLKKGHILEIESATITATSEAVLLIAFEE